VSNIPSTPLTGDGGAPSESELSPSEVERRWRDRGERAADRCIVVTGMHRSGATAIAGALCAAGAWAGPEAQLVPAVLDDSRDRYTRRDTTEALEAELVKLGGSWSNPPLEQLQPWTQEQLRPALRQVLSAATSDTPRGAVPLIKDPRLCLFAAELRTLLLDSWPVVVAVRHPLEVARSLHDRDGLSIQAGLALWEIYNQSICAGLAGRPVHVVRHDSLLDDADGVAGRLIGQVLTPDGDPLPRSAQDRAAAHLSRELRHHRADVADEDRWLSVAALRLWHQLESASQAPEATTLPVVELSFGAAQQIKLDATRRKLEIQVRDQAERLAGRDEDLADHDALRAEVAQLRSDNQSLAEAAASLAQAEERLAQAEPVFAANEALAAQVHELNIANQSLTQLVRETGELRATALRSLADVEADREQLAQRYEADVRRLLIELDTARGEIESARSAHADARDLADALLQAATTVSAALNETLEELARVNAHRQQLVDDINAISNSQSWRLGYALTWPVRAMRGSQRREGGGVEPAS